MPTRKRFIENYLRNNPPSIHGAGQKIKLNFKKEEEWEE